MIFRFSPPFVLHRATWCKTDAKNQHIHQHKSPSGIFPEGLAVVEVGLTIRRPGSLKYNCAFCPMRLPACHAHCYPHPRARWGAVRAPGGQSMLHASHSLRWFGGSRAGAQGTQTMSAHFVRGDTRHPSRAAGFENWKGKVSSASNTPPRNAVAAHALPWERYTQLI
jgi:hypothetical protein